MITAHDDVRSGQLALVNAALHVPADRAVSVNVRSDGSIGAAAGIASPDRRGSRFVGTGRPSS